MVSPERTAILNPADPIECAIMDLVALLRSKGQDYSEDGDPWSSFRLEAALLDRPLEEVPLGVVVQKLSRLHALRKNGREPNHESIRDTLKDLANWAILTYAVYKEVHQ
jgi:hypothetical protein